MVPRIYSEESAGLFFEKNVEYQLLSSENQFHHIKNVLRLNQGARLKIFNTKLGEWDVVISEFLKKDIKIIAKNQIRKYSPPTKPKILIFSLIKNDMQKLVFEKACECGVDIIVPIITKYSCVRSINFEKAQLILQGAAQQCERLGIPKIMNIISLDELIGSWNVIFPNTNLMMCCERQRADWHSKAFKYKKRAWIVGPEGGFSEEEKKKILAQEYACAVSLGKNILRAETASIASMAIDSYIEELYNDQR